VCLLAPAKNEALVHVYKVKFLFERCVSAMPHTEKVALVHVHKKFLFERCVSAMPHAEKVAPVHVHKSEVDV